VKCTMKKTLVLIILIFTFTAIGSAENFMFTVTGNYLGPKDSTYKTQYGGNKYYPEAKLSFKIKGNIFLWSSVGFLRTAFSWKEWSNKGIPLADMDSKRQSDKVIISGGLGYYVGYLTPHNFAVKLELGAGNIKDTITETAVMTVSGETMRREQSSRSGFGFNAALAVTYGLMKNIYAELSVGYLYAADKIDDKWINLGGLRASLGLGLKF